ncbi:Fe-S protein [Agromyces laixinhei]|uniref:Fe-S protein n=1 Tax=Agromyces laixinhei TaxID=2585717 RepID=UPI001116E6BB|nr:Fe-S protein [Agromyces laixinhei]
METLRDLVVLIHITGFAITFGAWFTALATRRKRVTRIMDVGLWVSLASGLILAAPWPEGIELDYLKLGLKFVILAALGGTLGVGMHKQDKTGVRAPAGIFWAVGGLCFTNAAIAVLW